MGQRYTEQRKIRDKYLRARSNWRRRMRLLFPSPLEVRFARILHGHTLTIPFIRSIKTGFPLTFIWRGKLLKRELMQREVRAGKCFIDYAVVTPYYKRGIELIGKRWHGDVIAEQERHDYLVAQGWQLMYLTHKQLADSRRTYVETLRFLKS